MIYPHPYPLNSATSGRLNFRLRTKISVTAPEALHFERSPHPEKMNIISGPPPHYPSHCFFLDLSETPGLKLTFLTISNRSTKNKIGVIPQDGPGLTGFPSI